LFAFSLAGDYSKNMQNIVGEHSKNVPIASELGFVIMFLMSRLVLYFLGATRIERDEKPITVGHNKAMALLVYLAITQQYHTREALAALLWPAHDASSARAEVRRMIWALNKSLGKEWLVVNRETVALLPQPDLWLDVDQFRSQLKVGLSHDHTAGELCSACLDALTKAAALARSDFLAGFTLPDCPAFDEWQRFEAESLRRELAGALERLTQHYQAQGQTGNEQAIAYARRWVALDPLQEQAHRQLMQLYAWGGQTAVALRQYQACSQALADELGVKPSPETTTLYEAIKTNRLSPQPQPVAFSADSGLATDVPIHHHLPAQLTSFIGRQQKMEAIREMMLRQDIRLITLTGVGGTGKTRLALEVAASLLEHFADGVFFVPLGDLSDPALVLPTIARQLGVQEGGSQSLLEIVKSSLHNKQILLILDNFEHVSKAASFIAELLAATTRLKILVTSRALLHLRGEWEVTVPPLQLPARTQAWSLPLVEQVEAVQLFVERAQAVQSDFALTEENVMPVAEICYRLDGLPLAIELAASRIKLLPPSLLLTRLYSRLKLLIRGAQDLPTRQQTLRSTIDWSYSLLDETEQVIFARLAVFAGGFTLDSAEAICHVEAPSTEPAGQVLDILEEVMSLLDNSLLISQDTGSQPRFRMLETIREYALERLTERGELAVIQQRHAEYFAAWLENFTRQFFPNTGLWLNLVEEEYDNLRTVLGWSILDAERAETGSLMVGVLYWFWYQQGYLSEGRNWCQWLLRLMPETGRTAGRASVLIGSGSLALMQGDLEQAIPWLDESVAIWRELESEKGLAFALLARGIVALGQGDVAVAQRAISESLSLGRQINHRWLIADSLLNMGGVAVAQGDYPAARAWLEEAMALAQTGNDRWLRANILNNLGEVSRVQGDYEQAQRSYEESCILFRETGHKADVARALHSLGYVALRLGDHDQAGHYFFESLAIFRELGNKRGTIECLAGLAAVRDQPLEAVRLLAAAETLLKSYQGSWWPADQIEFEHTLGILQDALDEMAFASAWGEGQSMTLEQALTYLLDTNAGTNDAASHKTALD
jgi:predicted ATPase/DNA-binding SARP family transcriptional activator/Tfp pilus assembly protein PilF